MDRVECAKKYFQDGYNCSQSVVAAYADLFGMDTKSALRFSEGFGGGMGRMRRTCGAVCGMFMLAGLKYSTGQPKDMQTRKKIYAVVQEMNHAFESINQSTVCSDLLGLNLPKDEGSTPTPRTEEFYKKRPCIGCIEDCAKIVERFLINEETTASASVSSYNQK